MCWTVKYVQRRLRDGAKVADISIHARMGD